MLKNRKHISYLITFAIIALLQMGMLSPESELNLLKSAYLERFSRFIEWSNESQIQEFNIVVIGEDGFRYSLEKVFKAQKIKGKYVKIKYYPNCSSFIASEKESDLNNIQIVYFSEACSPKLEKTLDYIKNFAILTVSHSSNFAKRGVHINYFTSGPYLKFEINEKAVKASGFKISHLLLQQAKLVK